MTLFNIITSGVYIDSLLEAVEADNIPQYIGGTLVDENGDPRCSAMVSYLKYFKIYTNI